MSWPALASANDGVNETKAERDLRMKWWRDARFGALIHWGLHSIPAGEWKGRKYAQPGEWLMFHAQIPVDEYEQLAKRFNPVKFDADRMVAQLKSAGFKYVIFTAKDHDGFCMFHSKLTVFDSIEATPFHRDPLKEVADACAKHGLRLGVRYSILDWHHPDYLPRGRGSPRPWDRRPIDNASFDRYLDYVKGQLRELLTGYGDVAVLWLDGGGEHDAKQNRADELVRFAHGIAPKLIVNDRLGLPMDFATPEGHVPATGMQGRDWEACITLNDTWGFKRGDRNWKPARTVIRSMIDAASRGGNLLINVGPDQNGEIPLEAAKRLEEIGRWLSENGESVFGAIPGPLRNLSWGRSTQRNQELFLHVYDWPRRILEVPGLRNAVDSAWLLADPGKSLLPVARSDNDVLIRLPEKPIDSAATVVVLKIKGQPDIATPLETRPPGMKIN